jgi:hypothetical protein
MKPKSDIEMFVKNWVARNVQTVKGLSNLPYEVDRLAASLTGDARTQGISGGDLNRAVGDIDDYLTAQYEQVCAAAA